MAEPTVLLDTNGRRSPVTIASTLKPNFYIVLDGSVRRVAHRSRLIFTRPKERS